MTLAKIVGDVVRHSDGGYSKVHSRNVKLAVVAVHEAVGHQSVMDIVVWVLWLKIESPLSHTIQINR